MQLCTPHFSIRSGCLAGEKGIVIAASAEISNFEHRCPDLLSLPVAKKAPFSAANHMVINICGCNGAESFPHVLMGPSIIEACFDACRAYVCSCWTSLTDPKLEDSISERH